MSVNEALQLGRRFGLRIFFRFWRQTFFASMFPERSRRLTAQAREELAERWGVGKVEVVGYLGDAHFGGLQQERGLHQ